VANVGELWFQTPILKKIKINNKNNKKKSWDGRHEKIKEEQGVKDIRGERPDFTRWSSKIKY
jgi:hypothetical protein